MEDFVLSYEVPGVWEAIEIEWLSVVSNFTIETDFHLLLSLVLLVLIASCLLKYPYGYYDKASLNVHYTHTAVFV